MPRASMKVEFVEYTLDGETIHHLPGKYEVCGRCAGRGSHSLRFGAITEEDRRQWDDESWEDYMAGHYDEMCERCQGKRVVLVVDRDRCLPDLLALYDKAQAEDAEHRAESWAERRMELYGAGERDFTGYDY